MSIKNISFDRKLSSYKKVQYLIGNIIRSRKIFINKKRVNGKKYLNVGCGPNPSKNFVNLDYMWTPDIDVCWDISKKKYPFNNNIFDGIYTEHCLEHISLESFRENISEFFRMLKPGGILRIIVPDGELYLDIYAKQKNGIDCKMPYQDVYITPMARINGIFRNFGHQFIYDYKTIEHILKEYQFKEITKVGYLYGRNKELLLDTEYRNIESLYVEAIK